MLPDMTQFTPVSLATATLVDPKIKVTQGDDLTFTLSAKGGVGAWTWLDHPGGTVGHFVDKKTGVPSNGFFLIPGIDRTGESLNSKASMHCADICLSSSAIHSERGTVKDEEP